MNYQNIVDQQRARHFFGGYGWPGKPLGSSAVSRYPNIMTELNASPYWLYLLADFAGVSVEIMAAVMEDNEELDCLEMQRLSHYWGRNPGYLFSHTLQVVDPTTNKGKKRRQQFWDLWNQAIGLEITGRGAEVVTRVANNFKRGDPISYAAYRWACHYIQEALKARVLKPNVRTVRRATV